MLQQFFQEEDGQTLVEYGLLISLIALVIVTVLTFMGRRVGSGYNAVATQIVTATS